MPSSAARVMKSSSATTPLKRWRKPREPFKPHDYQKAGIKWLIQRAEAALFSDPGLGKTSMATKAFQALQRAKVTHKALVVAPLRPCYTVWSQEPDCELARWEDFKDIKVSLIHGTEKERVAACEAEADMYVVNFDGLRWLIKSGMLLQMQRSGVDHLILDELSKFKHPRGLTFKLLKKHLGRFKRRWGLTGSPAANGLMDLFGEVYVLDLGKRLGRYITAYRQDYFVPSGYGGYAFVPQEDAEERIYRQLSDLALTMKANDLLDLPPLVERELWVDLKGKARKAYDEMEDVLFTELEGHTISAVNAAVASGKCRQVASGGVYLEPELGHRADETASRIKRKWLPVHDLKTDALEELVDELQGTPLLVAYEFHHDLQRIKSRLGDVPSIGGGVTGKETMDIARRWNDGAIPVLCGHPAAMGHGLNLQASGNHVAWYTTTWDYELYDQLIRRIWRQGTKAKRVIVHRIAARDTIDEAVLAALSSKRRGQDALFKGLKDLRARRR